MGYTITHEWLEHQLEELFERETPAIERFNSAKKAFDLANAEFIAAKNELESIRNCKKEFIWLVTHTGGKE